MPKYTVEMAANLRAYAVITVEAETEDLALARAEVIAAADDMWSHPEMADAYFKPGDGWPADVEVIDVEIEEDE